MFKPSFDLGNVQAAGQFASAQRAWSGYWQGQTAGWLKAVGALSQCRHPGDLIRIQQSFLLESAQRWQAAVAAFGAPNSAVAATIQPSARADRPTALSKPEGDADDLKRISGVGSKIENLLNGLGIFHFHQIAAFTPANVEWLDDQLKFQGRIGRERWVAQAKTLADGGETEFSRRYREKG